MPSQSNNSTIILAEDLTVKRGPAVVLQEITFQVNRGEMIGVMGPNGGGKTTLLRTLLGLIKPSAGRIMLFGYPAGELGPVRDLIGYIPQQRVYDRFFPISAADVVRTGCYSARTLLRPLRRKEKENCNEMLHAVDALHLAARPFGNLSGGEQQRVLLARALVRRPALLLLDEPITGLDQVTQQLFLDLLRRLHQDYGLTVLLVSHDTIALAAFAERLLCVNRTMHIHLDPQQLLRNGGLEKVYRCSYDLLEMAAAREGDSANG
ncbi:MAG: ABC transporter ATP-binding protein [Firmicutes bacterium]|nr:ABC transporter ATP-binding protein [Bacillota bacterium]